MYRVLFVGNLPLDTNELDPASLSVLNYSVFALVYPVVGVLVFVLVVHVFVCTLIFVIHLGPLRVR